MATPKKLKLPLNLLETDEGVWQLVALDTLVPADWNYKGDNDHTATKLRASLARNGQVQNLIIRNIGDGKAEVVNGNHRLIEMAGLGRTTAVVFNVGDVSLNEAVRVSIETNETNFPTDQVILAERLHELIGEFGAEAIEATTNFTAEDLKHLMAIRDVEWSQPEKFQRPEPPDTITLSILIPKDALAVLDRAMVSLELDRIRASKELRYGLTIEALAAEYFAGHPKEPG